MGYFLFFLENQLIQSQDVSVLPKGLANPLQAPAATTPAFIAVSLAFSALFVVIFTLISFRSKLGGKLSASLEKPFINRAVAWIGLLGFMIGTCIYSYIQRTSCSYAVCQV